MSKKPVALSRTANDVLRVLAAQIRVARHRKGWTAANLAARIGVSSRTVTAIEAAQPGVAIGSVLNAAAVTGVSLFAAEGPALTALRRRGEESVALLPTRTFPPTDDGRDSDDLAF